MIKKFIIANGFHYLQYLIGLLSTIRVYGDWAKPTAKGDRPPVPTYR